jgi:hypothetical protein
MAIANTIAYYDTRIIATVKSFKIQALSVWLGATVLCMTTFSIMPLSITTLSITTIKNNCD